jgi:hypothetical protein
MLIDAYRQLAAAKLFWLTLALSLLVVVMYGSVSFNENGMSVFYGLLPIDNEYFRAGSPWSRGLYIGIYSNFLVAIWLAWIATILALISTCTIFPQFISGGSIELTLSKPIHRTKLFLMKYVVSLLFVMLQVLVFCGGIFLCVGLRLGEWNWAIFAGVPIVTVFYSYLFAISVLVGMLTRSGITALLVTVIFWMVLWAAQTSETVLNTIMTDARVKIDRFSVAIEEQEATILEMEARAAKKGGGDFRIDEKRERIGTWREDIDEATELLDTLDAWYRPVSWGLAVLPKTAQTIGLLDRWLSSTGGFDLAAIMRGEMEEVEEFDPASNRAREQETQRRLVEDYGERSLWYVIGTSMLFEAVVVSIALWLFRRRDF